MAISILVYDDSCRGDEYMVNCLGFRRIAVRALSRSATGSAMADARAPVTPPYGGRVEKTYFQWVPNRGFFKSMSSPHATPEGGYMWVCGGVRVRDRQDAPDMRRA